MSRRVKILFFLCWLVYCTSYIGRLNYSSAMALMIAEEVLTSSAAGFISMLYFFAYGVGQLINGFLADHAEPVRMIAMGLIMSAIANLCMGLGHGFLYMALVWALNGYFQSMIWAPIIKIFAETLSERDKINCSVNIVSSGVIGTLLSYVLSAVLIAFLPWNSVFFAAAVLLFMAAIVFYLGIQTVLNQTLENCKGGEDTLTVTLEHPPMVRTNKLPTEKKVSALILSTGILFLLIPVIIHGMLKDGITVWVPTYIIENFEISASFSILLTAVLPIVNLMGAYIGRFVYLHTQKNIGLSLGVFFAFASVALVLLLTKGNISVIITLSLLAVITSSMMAINTLAINVYPLRFYKYGHVSSMSGFLNATAYLGSALSTYVIGILVEQKGWQTTILTWLSGAVIAFVLCMIAVQKVKEI